MDPTIQIDESVRRAISGAIGTVGWFVLAAILLSALKDSVASLLAAYRVFRGNAINEDDMLIVDGRPARVVRTSLWYTAFYYVVIDAEGYIRSGTRVKISNVKLDEKLIEKPLPMLDSLFIKMHADASLAPLSEKEKATTEHI